MIDCTLDICPGNPDLAFEYNKDARMYVCLISHVSIKELPALVEKR